MGLGFRLAVALQLVESFKNRGTSVTHRSSEVGCAQEAAACEVVDVSRAHVQHFREFLLGAHEREVMLRFGSIAESPSRASVLGVTR